MIEWHKFAIPKPTPRVVNRIAQKRAREAAEQACRRAVKARDQGKCRVPGCKERGSEMHHIVPRSLSTAKRWLTSNNCLLCKRHHDMRHTGLIQISGNADEELIITGDAKLLRFSL